MKKSILSFVFILIGWAANADGYEHLRYIVTKSDTIICDDFVMGRKTSTLLMSDGEKMVVKTKDILKYSEDNRIFEKMPLVFNQKATNTFTLMELKRKIYNLKVYQYSYYDSYLNSTINSFYVYNTDGKFIVQINEKNKSTLLPFLELTEL